LCIRLDVVPAADASVGFSMLNEIQQELMLWCVNTVHARLGECMGLLGERAVFRFVQAFDAYAVAWQELDPAQNITVAASVAMDLSSRLRRRSRLLEVQHGVHIAFSAALHQHGASGERSELNHAVNVALNLLSFADPGTILSNEGVQRLSAHRLRFAPWTPRNQNQAPKLAFRLLGAVI